MLFANILLGACLISSVKVAQALSIDPRIGPSQHLQNVYGNITPLNRRDAIATIGIIGSTISTSSANAAGPSASQSSASNGNGPEYSYSPGGLASKLSQRNPSLLKNSLFNIPPSAQVYPKFLRGSWDVTINYRGFIFPSQSISKEKIIQNLAIPGFQKCSVAFISDIGKESATYRLNIDEKTGFEDRKTSFRTSINSHLGYTAIQPSEDAVIYDVNSNPNRISIDFIPNRTRNANRIELFCNGRESELVVPSNDIGGPIFVCSEYIRQVTFGLSQEFGVARQVVGNYAHFWTWRGSGDSASEMITGNLLTAAYIDPQDAMFFEEPSKPVVVYSHDLTARRVV